MALSSKALRGILMGILVAAILLMSSPEVVSASPNPNLGRKFLAVYAQDYVVGGYATGRGGYYTPPSP